MKIYENKYTQAIYDILEPLVGKSMTQGAIKAQIKAIGSTEETLTRNDLQRLSEGVKKGLVIFIGSDAAQKVASKISKLT
jgi:hypothetical protein